MDLPVPEPAPATVLAPPPMATRAAEEAAAGTPDALDVTAPAAAPPPVRRVPDPTPTEAAPASPATAQRAGAAIPGIAGLATAQRERLPAMKLSMHMWNEDPARRFVVIDGQRRVEGDRVGDATIVAIDRDGVLLDLDGQPVRVPLP